MPDDINGLDVTDAGLKAIMGNRFQDVTEPVKAVSKKETPTKCKEANVAQKPKEKAMDAQWEPVRPALDCMEKLKNTAKDVCLYAVLSLVLFYWQQTGRLEVTTSWYALLVCVGMVFFSVGKNCRGGDRR